MEQYPEILIGIVNWNGGAHVLECLDSLKDLTYPSFRIVVVDNASRDGSPGKIREKFPEVLLIENSHNEGFSRANNRVLRMALEEKTGFVLLLNNDTLVEPSFLERLVAEVLRCEKAALAGPRICYHPSRDRIWAVGGEMVFGPNLVALIGHKKGDRYGGAPPFEADFLPGCALLIKREAVERIGFLNEDYFAYMEDVEFCMRARKAGFKCLVVPQAVVYHRPSFSTGGDYSQGRKYLQALHTVRFLREWGSLKNWVAFLLFDLACLPFVCLLEGFRGKGRAALAKAMGIWDGFRGRRVKAWLEPEERFSRKKIRFF